MISGDFEIFALEFEVRKYLLKTLDFSRNAKSVDKEGIEELKEKPSSIFNVKREEIMR